MLDLESPPVVEPKKRKPKMGRPKTPRGARVIILTLKGYPEFDAWLRGLAAHRRLPVSVLIEHALIEYAREHDYQAEAPER